MYRYKARNTHFFTEKQLKMTVPIDNWLPMEATGRTRFNTVEGRAIDLRKPSEEAIEICDIAGALSLICRFGGHVNRFYSVAQHSLVVCALAPDDLKREALLHDAPEAYLGDVIKPLKRLLGPAYRELECCFEDLICRKYGVDPGMIKAVKEFDLLAQELEHEALRLGDATRLVAVMQRNNMVIDGTEAFYRPLVAKIQFLEMFNLLFSNYATKGDNGKGLQCQSGY